MTGDATKVDNAIDTLTPTGGGDYPESYNLVFQKSTDPATGWRAGSRKLVVVIGDAEPHGAGTDGFAGCTDHSSDTHALSTKTVLAGMRAAQRTLIMVRRQRPRARASSATSRSRPRATPAAPPATA